MQYGPQESGAQASAIAPALKSTFGYSSATLDNYSFTTLVSEISANRPVILTAFDQHTSAELCFFNWCLIPATYGNGHCWVADGYQTFTQNTCGTISEYDMIDMNWGWGGQSNGWYSSTSWTPSGTSYNFQYLQQMVHSIHP